MRKLSVVVPVYNEEKILDELFESIRKVLDEASISFEVIFVDDGSNDRSWAHIAMLSAQYAHVKGLKLTSNVGQHNAIIAGFSYAEGHYIITIDADLQDSPAALPKICQRLDAGYDMVGCKRVVRKDSLLRRSLSWLMHFTIRHFSRLSMVSSNRITDYGCMLRGYQRWVVERVIESGGKSIYIPTFAATIGGKVCEIEIEHTSREKGRSKYGFRDLLNLYFDMITDVSLFPIQLISFAGMVLSFAGFALGIVIFIRRIFIGPEVEGVFTLFAFLFIFSGVLLVSVGLIGEYVGRIYREVNRAPRFIVKERTGFREGLRIGVCAYSEVGFVCLKQLIDSGEEVVFVVTHAESKDENIWFRSVAELAHAHHIPVFIPQDVNEREFIDAISALKPDVIFSFYFRKIFGKELRAVPPKGCINLHGSLLPRYRGRAPINWVLLNGEKETGITFHYMTGKVDGGPIVAQQKISIEPGETARSLTDKVAVSGAKLLTKLVAILHQGKPKGIVQDEEKASYFGERTPDMGKIEWDWSSERIDNYVRALAEPFPGAFFPLRSKTCVITRGKPAACVASEKGGSTQNLQVDDTLVKFGDIPRETRMKFMTKKLQIPSISLKDIVPDSSLVTLVNESLARRYDVFPVRTAGKTLMLAMSAPYDIHAIEDISLITGMDILPRGASSEEIRLLLDQYYGGVSRNGSPVEAKPEQNVLHSGTPGTIMQLGAGGMLVKTGDSCFNIQELKIGEKRFAPLDFARSMGITVGDSLAG
jgi:undecaprenyl-phosphate 4-deoxy-4-formamido-L-arabinose transferase